HAVSLSRPEGLHYEQRPPRRRDHHAGDQTLRYQRGARLLDTRMAGRAQGNDRGVPAGVRPDRRARWPPRSPLSGQAGRAATGPGDWRAHLSGDLWGSVETHCTELGPVADSLPPEPGDVRGWATYPGPSRRLGRADGRKTSRVAGKPLGHHGAGG